MFSKFAALGFSEKFFIGFVLVGLLVSGYARLSTSGRQADRQSAEQLCIKEAEELKANALPHEVWKKVPPVCDAQAIMKLEQKTPTQKAILDMTDEKQAGKSFPSFIWFVLIGYIPLLIGVIRRQMNKADKNG
jgi:hypothetical protein